MGFSGTKLELSLEDFYSEPNLRQQFKLILNSMLGKLAQQPHKEHNQLVTSEKQLQEIMKNCDITNISITNEEFCHVSLKGKEASKVNKKGNCIVYAFITARTRILMHKNLIRLQKSGHNLFYTDCDSIIFSAKKGSHIHPIPIGGAFGDFKPELGKGAKITSFSCTGRKQFRLGYSLPNSKEEEILFKIKGISLSSHIARQEVYNQFPKADTLAKDMAKEAKMSIPQIRRIENSCKKQIFHLSTNSNCQRKGNNDENLTTFPWGF